MADNTAIVLSCGVLKQLYRFIYWFVLLLSMISPSLYAITAKDRGIVIVSHQSSYEMIHRIEAALYTEESFRPNISHINAEQLTEETLQPHSGKLIITLGESALEKVLEKKPNNRILATMIRKNQFKEVLDRQNKILNLNNPQVTAIFLDQPINRQLNLAACLIPPKPHKRTVGVILGPRTSSLQTPLRQAAKQRHLALNIVHVSPNENPMNVMQYVFEDADVLLAILDKDIYNIHTARGILLSAFHHHVPVIGFSQTYVNLGALAAVYSTPHQIALEVAESIMEIIKHPREPLFPPRSPNTFKVALNEQVGRFFSIPKHTESALKYAIDQMEQNKTTQCVLLKPRSPL